VNPLLQHTVEVVQHLVFPEVMSLKRAPVKFLAPAAYRVGLIKPTEGKPTERRAAFTSEIIAAKTGADADVPYKLTRYPLMTTGYCVPMSDTSG
jgi:hypothetical protein